MWNRRQILSLAAGPALAQAPRGMYRDYSRCLPDYLRDLAQKSYRLRNAELAKLTSPAAIEQRRRWARATFWKLVGGEPPRTPLNARTIGSFERPGHRVEKLVYESQPGFHIPANLYIPKDAQPPFPGVLFQMGHAQDGKAYPLYQRCCQGLARLGFLVLAFDPMGQGERTYYPGSNPARTRLDSADEEHTYPGRPMLLNGITSTRLQTWDAVRSLDYLAAHPLVDPKRLASTGQSGGGTNTMLLAAVDDRLSCAVITCPNTENVAAAGFNSPGSTDDAEQNFPGGGPLGFDRWDLLYPFAPKPLLVAVSERDFFGTYSPKYIENGLEEFGKLKRIYTSLGKGAQIEWWGSPLPHGLSYEVRMRVYRWFARWMQDDREVREEPPTEPEPEAALFVSESGNMVRSFGGETPFSLNRKHAVQRTPRELADVLGVERPANPKLVTVGRTEFRDAHIEAVEVASAPRVWVPAYLFQSKRSAESKKVILILDPSGRTAVTEGALYDQLAAKGAIVCAADLRGINDLQPEFGRGSARHARSHQSDENYAWSALTFGKPMVGQRATDIIALAEGLRERFQSPVTVAARGLLTAPALFAARLSSAIGQLYLAGGLVSFQSLVELPDYRYPMSGFVMNILGHTDLPEEARALSATRVVMAGPLDAAGRAAPEAEVRRLYGDRIVYRQAADWSADGIWPAV